MKIRNKGGMFWRFIGKKCYYVGEGVLDVPEEVGEELLKYSFIESVEDEPSEEGELSTSLESEPSTSLESEPSTSEESEHSIPVKRKRGRRSKCYYEGEPLT